MNLGEKAPLQQPLCSGLSLVGTAVTDAVTRSSSAGSRGVRTQEKPPADAVQVVLGSVSQHVQGPLPVLQWHKGFS